MPKKPTKPKAPEPPKALAKTHGPRPKVDGPSVIRATGKALVSAIPFVGRVLAAISDAEQRTKTRRLEQWAAYLQHEDEDDAAFAARVIEALHGDEGDHVRAAVLESAKAANEALDDAVVPSIARLTSRYLTTKTPDLWTYRDLLGLLRSLDAEMFAVLKAAVDALAAFSEGDDVSTRLDSAPGDDAYVWIATRTVFGKHPSEPQLENRTCELVRGQIAYRLVLALSGSATGLFSGASRLNYPHFTPLVIATLHAVL